jgi:hypothetical protein
MVFYRCEVCSTEALAPQPGRYTRIPDGWFWREKSEDTPQMHVCGDKCLAIMTVERHIGGWVEIDRANESKPRVGRENCKACKAMKSGGPCLFHRPRGKAVAVTNG